MAENCDLNELVLNELMLSSKFQRTFFTERTKSNSPKNFKHLLKALSLIAVFGSIVCQVIDRLYQARHTKDYLLSLHVYSIT